MRPLALLVPLLLASPPARADQPPQAEAQSRFDQAMSLYAAHQYRAAAAGFAQAYALDPTRREVLFAQAQATRLAGDCPAALPLYQQFLATNPPPQQVEATRIAVSRCEAATLTATGPPRNPAPPTISPPPPPPPPRWYSDRAGAALTGAGLVATGVGAALIASARATDREAAAVRDRYDTAAALRDRAESRWAWGVGTLVAGSALVLAGAGRYLWVGLHPKGAVVSAGSRF